MSASACAATSSGVLAVSTGAVVPPSAAGTSNLREGRLWGMSITPSSADCTLTVYDNNAGDNSGTLLEKITVKASTATVLVDYAVGVCFNSGLSYILSGTGATAVIHYSLGA